MARRSGLQISWSALPILRRCPSLRPEERANNSDWEIGLSRWDIAAGVLLVREAGGVVTDPLGTQTELDTGDIVAAGPRMHRFMLEVTRGAFGSR